MQAEAIVALALLTAGCLAGTRGSGGEPLADEAPEATTTGTDRFLGPFNVTKEDPGAEPIVDVASDGTVFVQGIGFDPALDGFVVGTNVNKVFRSTDGGQSWEDVTPPVSGEQGTLDAALAVGNDDTVYVFNAFGGTLSMWRSTDLGETWVRLPVPPPPAEVLHRAWIATEGEETVHLVLDRLDSTGGPGFFHLRSDDRGLTWTRPTQVDGENGFGSDLALGPEGNLYIARLDGQNTGDWELYRSTDGGTTWRAFDMFEVQTRLESSWQSLAVDDAGRLYFAWAEMRDGRAVALYSSSLDQGRSWSEPKRVTDGQGTETLPWIEALDPGRVAVATYAADEAGAPAEIGGPWFVDVTFLSDAHTDQPVRDHHRITPWPIHHGNICNDGPGCDAGSRQLLDYLWIEEGPDGRAHVAYASTEWNNHQSAFPAYAVERAGAAT